MADLQKHDPLVEAVAKARKESSRRPDEKFPIGRLNIMGRYFYAYSGEITGGTSATRMLEFTTTSNALYCKTLKMNITAATASGANYQFDVKFNGQKIYTEFYTAPHSGRQPADSDNIYLIIPPYTKVTIDFNTSSGNKEACVIVVGEVI